MQNLTRTLAILLPFALLVPVASAQSMDLSAVASADASGVYDAATNAKARATGLVDDARAQVEAEAAALQAQVEAEAYATTEQASGFGAQAMAILEGALAGLQGFAASIAASLDVSFG